MSSEEEKEIPEEQVTEEDAGRPSAFPELDKLQDEVTRRIRDNQKFLDHFMDKDYVDEDDEDEDDDEEFFEEL